MVSGKRKGLIAFLICCFVFSGCANTGRSETVESVGAGEKAESEECVEIQESKDIPDSLQEHVISEETPEEAQEVSENPTEYTGLSAEEFVNYMNIGWNLGDALGSSAKDCGYDANPDLEIKWGNPYVTEDLISYVSSLGFNTIRIPVSWYYNCGRDSNGQLIVGEQWMARVKEVVGYALENNLYVILNTMCDSWEIFRCGVESEEEWNKVRQDAEDLWTQIAEAFKEYDGQLLFESYNELDNAVQGWTYSDLAVAQMNELNQIFVTAVRNTGGNNQNRILLVPTLFDSTKTDMTGSFILPEDTANEKLIATVHCYEEEFDQDIEWIFQSLEEFSDRIGAPVIIGEFGARDDYCLINWREEFTSNYIARAAAHGIKCCVWDDGYHWKLIDRYDYTESNLSVIQALFDGLEGTAYETEPSKKLVIDSMDRLSFASLGLDTGVVEPVDYETKFWAALTTMEEDGEWLEIQEGDKLSVTMIAKNNAVNFWIYGVTFLDENRKPISYTVGKNISHKFLCTDIPKGAKYFAVNTFDPYANHKLEEIERYLAAGDLGMIITFVDSTSETQLYKRNQVVPEKE